MINPMIAALQKSRSSSTGGDVQVLDPGVSKTEGPGDAMIQKLAGLEAKIDMILKALGAEQKEDASEGEKTEGKETTENDYGN